MKINPSISDRMLKFDNHTDFVEVKINNSDHVGAISKFLAGPSFPNLEVIHSNFKAKQISLFQAITSWWFQPIWKILVKMGIFPK